MHLVGRMVSVPLACIIISIHASCWIYLMFCYWLFYIIFKFLFTWLLWNTWSAIVETEGPEEEETDHSDKNGVDKNLEKTDILNNEEQNPVSALPTTPLQLCRFLPWTACFNDKINIYCYYNFNNIFWTDLWFNCHFHQRANHHGPLLPSDHLPHCIMGKDMESLILFGLKTLLKSISKLLQKMKCLRFYEAILLPTLASRLLLPTVRGSLLLNVS